MAGVVGWAPLADPDLSAILHSLVDGAGGRYLRGIRHQVHDESDPDWIARPEIVAGVGSVGKAGLVYDLLSKEPELPACIRCVAGNPEMQFVLDHIAKPRIAQGELEPWRSLITTLAGFPNVSCKISGMVTEADWKNWELSDFEPFLRHVVSAFGPDRLMFGSDWPVCLLAGSYDRVYDLATGMLSGLDADGREKVFGLNARRIYGIE